MLDCRPTFSSVLFFLLLLLSAHRSRGCICCKIFAKAFFVCLFVFSRTEKNSEIMEAATSSAYKRSESDS